LGGLLYKSVQIQNVLIKHHVAVLSNLCFFHTRLEITKESVHRLFSSGERSSILFTQTIINKLLQVATLHVNVQCDLDSLTRPSNFEIKISHDNDNDDDDDNQY
jgi:hypothetical protein